MGVLEAPQWLLPAYVRSVKAVGASAPVAEIQASGEALIDMWMSPGRHFHNLRHVIDMLARVDELADESHCPDTMRLAAWYHGCKFSTDAEGAEIVHGVEDEVASAAYAREDLEALGVPAKTVERITELILHLHHDAAASEDIDAMALADADLGTLAVGPQQYKKYRELVREEYAHIPARDYVRARLTIVRRLLARESLFSSPLGAQWEAAARQNLEAERVALEAKLKKIEASGCETTAADAALGLLDAQVARAAEEGERIAAARQAHRETGAALSSEPPVFEARTVLYSDSMRNPEYQAYKQETLAALAEKGLEGAFGHHGPHEAAMAAPSDAAAGRAAGGTGGAAGAGAAGGASAGVSTGLAAGVTAAPGAETAGEKPGEPASDEPVADEVPMRSVAEGRVAAESLMRTREAMLARKRAATEDQHVTSMESCAADLDRLLATPRAATYVDPITKETVVNRRVKAEEARLKVAEQLRAKAEAARALREARTGELPAVS